MSTTLQVEHPHVMRRPDLCGGEPIIDGLRVTVRHVATLYRSGEGIAEIAESLNLTEAQVVHGLSYYFDHRAEIDALISTEDKARLRTEPAQRDVHDNWWRHLQEVRAQIDAEGGPFRSEAEIEADRASFREDRPLIFSSEVAPADESRVVDRST